MLAIIDEVLDRLSRDNVFRADLEKMPYLRRL
jgi:hypothetical protein